MKIIHAFVIYYYLSAVAFGWTLRYDPSNNPRALQIIKKRQQQIDSDRNNIFTNGTASVDGETIRVGDNTLRIMKKTVRQTSTLIFYTLKGDERQLESLCLNVKLLSRVGVPEALQKADILVYDHGGPMDGFGEDNRLSPVRRETMINTCVNQCNADNTQSLMTAKHVGYRMGAVQALDAMMDGGFLNKYKWVVHLQPDIFVIDPHPLAAAMGANLSPTISGKDDTVTDRIVRGQKADNCLTFGFFAFRPAQVRRNAFSNWKIYDGKPECFLADEAFGDAPPLIVPHDGEKHFANTGIDEFGLSHQHRVKVIEDYLESHPTVD